MKVLKSLFIIIPCLLVFGFKKNSPVVTNNFGFSDTTKIITYKAKFVRKISHGCCCYVTIDAVNRFEVLMITKEQIGLKMIDVEYPCESTNFVVGKYYTIIVKPLPAVGLYKIVSTSQFEEDPIKKNTRTPVIPASN